MECSRSRCTDRKREYAGDDKRPSGGTESDFEPTKNRADRTNDRGARKCVYGGTMERTNGASLATCRSVSVGAFCLVRKRLRSGNTGSGPVAFSRQSHLQMPNNLTEPADHTLQASRTGDQAGGTAAARARNTTGGTSTGKACSTTDRTE